MATEKIKKPWVNLKGLIYLEQVRCIKCGKVLCKAEGKVEIKCKCGKVNLIDTQQNKRPG